MSIHIRYFAALREPPARETKRLSCRPERRWREVPTLAGRTLSRPHGCAGALCRGDQSLLCDSSQAVLDDGDELAFIPPLGGG